MGKGPRQRAEGPASDVLCVEGPQEVARAAVDEVARLARESVAERGAFRVALAGGSTPRRLYELLASESGHAFEHWHVYWGDERCVSPEDEASNYGMAREALLAKVPIPASQVHRISTELGEAEQVAADYARRLTADFGLAAGEWPRFDLVLLGMGADGHTASLFPGSPALGVRDALVTAAAPGPEGAGRVTLTVPVINAARAVVILVCGAPKAPALRAVLEAQGPPRDRPVRLVVPERGSLLWIVDRAAAGL